MRASPPVLAMSLLAALLASSAGAEPPAPAAPIGEGAFDSLFAPGERSRLDLPGPVEPEPRRGRRRQDGDIAPPLPLIVRDDEAEREIVGVPVRIRLAEAHDRFVMRIDRRPLVDGRIYYSSWVAACLRRHPSFDPRSGTVLGEDGAARRCE